MVLATERVVPEEDAISIPESEEMAMPREEPEQMIADAYLAAQPQNEWQRRFKAEYDSDPYKAIDQYLPVRLGDVTVGEARAYKAKLVEFQNTVNHYS